MLHGLNNVHVGICVYENETGKVLFMLAKTMSLSECVSMKERLAFNISYLHIWKSHFFFFPVDQESI